MSFFSGGVVLYVFGVVVIVVIVGYVLFLNKVVKVNVYVIVGIFMSFAAICVFGVTNLMFSKFIFMNFVVVVLVFFGLV